MPSVYGYFFDSQTSASQKARIETVDSGRVMLVLESGSQCFSMDELKVTSRLGNTPRHVAFPDGGRFETQDNEAIDALLTFYNRQASALWLYRLESKLRYVVLGVLVTVGFIGLMVLYGLPAGAKMIAMQMPVSVSTGISEQVFKQLDQRIFQPTQLPESTQERLRARFREVTEQVEEPFVFELYFRRGGSGLGANAFALPSGLILMTDELVALAEDDNELVAILAHEVGHVVHRHGVRQVMQQTALGLVVTYITGDTSSLIGALPLILLQLGYSREFEREADQYALDYLNAAEISSVHFVNIMKRLDDRYEDEEGFGHYLSTHPPTRERLERFLTDK